MIVNKTSLSRARSLSLSLAAATGSRFLFLRILEQDVCTDEGYVSRYVSRFIETTRFKGTLQVNARLVVQNSLTCTNQ